MTATAIAVALAVVVATAIVSAAGIVAARNLYERLHFIGVAATVGSTCCAIAVGLREGVSTGTAKIVLVALLLWVANAVLGHATARARWTERVPR